MRPALLTVLIVMAACGEVYLSETEAARTVLRGSESIEREERTLTPEDRAALEKAAGLRFPAQRYVFFTGKRKGRIAGYAVVMREIGKSEPITFMVGVDSDGKVGEVAVMEFRESRGGEVREPRFTRQFRGKRLQDPIRINQDILNYSGATLSSEALARGVKKAVALVDHFYLRVVTRASYVMGTLATVKLCARDAAAAWLAFAEMRRLDDRFTTYRESELTRLNRRAAAEPVPVSGEMFGLLELAARFARRYAGAFDVTLGPAVRAWGFLGGPFRVPAAAEQESIRRRVGIEGLKLDPSRRTVRFLKPGMEIDLGGIAKGYAAERAARVLAGAGVERAIVSLGESSLFALGPPPGRASWPVAVLDAQARPSRVVELAPFTALSTSGAYGRSFRAAGRVYSHLFDPRTATPLETTATASAVCPSGAESEAAAKALLFGQNLVEPCHPVGQEVVDAGAFNAALSPAVQQKRAALP